MAKNNNSRKGLIIGGLVVGAIAVAGFRHLRKNKGTPEGQTPTKEGQNSWFQKKSGDTNKNINPSDHKKDSKGWTTLFNEKKERPLTEEAKKDFEELKTEATESYEKLKHDTYEKSKQLNEKLTAKAHEFKSGAEEKTKDIQMEAEQQLQKFRDDTDRAIQSFKKDIEDRAKSIRQKATEWRDEASAGLENLSREARETVLKWKKDTKDYMDSKVAEAKAILDKNFPPERKK